MMNTKASWPRFPTNLRSARPRAAGFTMIELVVSMVIASVVVGMVSIFIRSPVMGYIDSVRRAELTDTADYSLRRIAREVRLALPNSLRVTDSGGVTYIEFIVTSGGGRYCSTFDGIACTNELSFNSANPSTTFDVVGMPAANVPIARGDFIVVNNWGQDVVAHHSNAPADAYASCGGAAGCNIAAVAGVAGNTVTLSANRFAAQSPPMPSNSSRFHVVPSGVRAVTYACPAARGVMRRYMNYGFNAAQVTPPVGGSSSIIANNARCVVSYDNNVGNQRTGMLTIALTLFDDAGEESVILLREIHLDNSP
jgi:MSHA biogenesis protein MshO